MCDGNDANTPCLKCPEGYKKNPSETDPKKMCVKTDSETKMVDGDPVELTCPGGLDGPEMVDGKAVCIDDCECEDEPPKDRMGTHQSWGETTCNCKRHYPIACKNLGADTKLDEKTMECKFKVPKTSTNTDTKPRMPAFEGFTGPNPAGLFFKALKCPERLPMDVAPLFCGPKTPPYIKLLLKDAKVQLEKKPKQALKECLINCASFYAKLQECAVFECDKGSITGSTPINSYVKDKAPKEPKFASIASGNPESIPNRLYMSKDNGALWAKVSDSLTGSANLLGDGVTDEGVDAAGTFRNTQSTFAKNPFAVDCRSWSWNNVRAALNKGNDKKSCQAACETKYK